MAWSRAEIELMAARMAARKKGFRVSEKTAPLVAEALAHFARTGMSGPLEGYALEIWEAREHHLLEQIGLIQNLNVSRAAFDEAVRQFPAQIVKLRRGAWTLASTGKKAE